MFIDKYLVKLANRRLNDIPELAGRVGGLSWSPRHGAYRLQNLKLEKKGTQEPRPSLAVRSAEARISRPALLRRVLATKLSVEGYALNLVAGEHGRGRQIALDRAWMEKGRALFPIRVDELSLRDGALRLSFPQAEPPAALWVENIQLQGRNLTNREHLRTEHFATWSLRADFMGVAPVEALLRTNLLTPLPSFDIRGRLQDLPLSLLNDFLHAFANLDVSSGSYSAYFDLTLHERMVSGYVESNFTDLEVARWDEGKPWSTFKKLRHGLFTRSIEKLEDDNEILSIRIPIQGRLGEVRPDLPSAVASVLNNAFLQSLEPGLVRRLKRSQSWSFRGAEPRPSSEQGHHP